MAEAYKFQVKAIGPRGGVKNTVSFVDGISAMGWLRNPDWATLRRKSIGAVLLALYEKVIPNAFDANKGELKLAAVGITPEMNRRFQLEEVFVAALSPDGQVIELSQILRQTAEIDYINTLPAMEKKGEKHIAAKSRGSERIVNLLKIS